MIEELWATQQCCIYMNISGSRPGHIHSHVFFYRPHLFRNWIRQYFRSMSWNLGLNPIHIPSCIQMYTHRYRTWKNKSRKTYLHNYIDIIVKKPAFWISHWFPFSTFCCFPRDVFFGAASLEKKKKKTACSDAPEPLMLCGSHDAASHTGVDLGGVKRIPKKTSDVFPGPLLSPSVGNDLLPFFCGWFP